MKKYPKWLKEIPLEVLISMDLDGHTLEELQEEFPNVNEAVLAVEYKLSVILDGNSWYNEDDEITRKKFIKEFKTYIKKYKGQFSLR